MIFRRLALFLCLMFSLAEGEEMHLTSSAFNQDGAIPSVYTCEGAGYNPPLEITGIPAAAKSLVLIMDDPDVPSYIREDQLWVHWVVYDIPPSTKKIAENSTPPGTVGKGTGMKAIYDGPCPPDRKHRYFFKLYALNVQLHLHKGATKEEVEEAMEGHILAQTQLMGTYEKKKK